MPADTSTVEVNYEGKLIDGTVFDSSYRRNQSAQFKANQVIKGWVEALTHMPEGSTWNFISLLNSLTAPIISSKFRPTLR